jgi:hypothetical protein
VTLQFREVFERLAHYGNALSEKDQTCRWRAQTFVLRNTFQGPFHAFFNAGLISGRFYIRDAPCFPRVDRCLHPVCPGTDRP